MNYPKLVNDVASFSNCKRRQVGALIVTETGQLITGYNHISDIHDLEICQRCPREGREPGDWDYTDTCPALHAEQDAITKAAKLGHRLDGAMIYINAQPCNFCQRLIDAAGLITAVL